MILLDPKNELCVATNEFRYELCCLHQMSFHCRIVLFAAMSFRCRIVYSTVNQVFAAELCYL
jgi:hypothetical protein